MSRLVMGVDGGGSSTVARVADESGRVLGRAVAGPSNVKAVGEAAGLAAIDAAIRSAMAEAGVDSVAVACLGLAGIDRPDDRALIERWHAERGIAGRLVLVNDGELVLAAGTPDGWGVAVIAGTGSIVVGKAPDGRSARAGGWGPIFGDEGSGYSVAIAALRLVAKRFDGRREGDWRDDALTSAICRAVGVANPSGLVTAVYGPGFDRARIAALAPVVVSLAETDEAVRSELLVNPGVELGETALAVARRLGLDPSGLPLALAGGFLLSADTVSLGLREYLGHAGYELRVRRVEEPVEGAIVLARRALATDS